VLNIVINYNDRKFQTNRANIRNSITLYNTVVVKSFLKKLFNKIENEDFSYSKPIKRSEHFVQTMQENEGNLQDLLSYIKSEWSKSIHLKEDISTYAINRKDVAGIVLKFQGCTEIKMHHFLLEHIKQELQNQGYIVNVNKHLSQRVSGKCEELWSYFLKPRPSFNDDGKYDQRYGTVMIELKKDDTDSYHFRLQCGYYSGFNYVEPTAFEELLDSL
jgi:hypothetical protein